MTRSVTISSSANPLIKDVRRAVERGGLTAQGWCVAESVHLLEEALRSAEVQQVLAADGAAGKVEVLLRRHRAVPLAILPEVLFRTVSTTEASQGVLALVKPRAWTMDHLFGTTPLVTVLDGVQDPGNAGAIVRAAEAFGGSGVIFLKGTASPHNPKTLRASAGSLFRVPYMAGMEAAEVLDAFARKHVEVYAAVPSGNAQEADLTRGCALIIGSEGRGVSEGLRAAAKPLSIPTKGVESLNAAVAAGILLYEAARRRSGRR